MKTVKRKSVGTHFSMCVQPAFIIGTNNEDGTYNFAPITWVSITNEKDNDYLLTISMFGKKKTKQNVLRTGVLSVNTFDIDLTKLDPVIYSGMYHSIGQMLGKIGDFSK